MSGVPVLETPRLRLREHRVDDLQAYTALWQDETVVRYIGAKPLTPEQIWARLLRYRGMWAMLGFGFWIIEDRETGRLLGEAGVQELRRDISPSIAGTLECGWMLAPDLHGKGLAYEAMASVLDWSARAHPSSPLTCLIEQGNAASIRLARRLGFEELAHAVYNGAPLTIFRHEGR